jgi:hypothetical protein
MITIIIGIVSKSLEYLNHHNIGITEEDKLSLIESGIRTLILTNVE